MNEEKQTNSPIALPRISMRGDSPFAGDLFQREELAKKLTTYIDRLSEGSVLAIDGQWGEGKTWFGLNWAANLKEHGHKIVFLDAFEQDYIEDPFLLIAAEITEVLEDNQGSAHELRTKAASVMKAILPIATRATLNLAGRIALGTSDFSKQIESTLEDVTDETSDSVQKWIEKKIENHGKEKTSLRQFKEELAKFCVAQEKPVVFFVDELDRCRPSFAIRLVERVKHFFDVPNLVFVLLLNRSQLEKAIKGVYGVETDAHAYLGKFVHLFLSLPKGIGGDGRSNFNWIYLWDLAKRYKLEEDRNNELGQFIDQLSVLASLMNLSLRDLEKGMALLVLANAGASVAYLAWLIALKLKYPDIFNGILRGDKEAHEKAAETLSVLRAEPEVSFWIQEYFMALHTLYASGLTNLSDGQKESLKQYGPHYRSSDPMKLWLKRLDIAILD